MSIQMKAVIKLRNEWEAKGSPICEHKFDKEYFFSAPTGDLACIYCGKNESNNEESGKTN